jgi:RNA polymerase sigma-70 factor (ECF subfamily)
MGDTSSYLRDNPVGNTEFLVGKAKEGSQAAWEEILERYRKMLRMHVRARLKLARRDSELDDVLQSAFLKAFQHIAKFEYRGEGSFRRWLATLVVRTYLNEIKARGPESGANDGALEHLEDEASTSRLAQSSEQTALLEALGKLDDEDRDILIQKMEDLSFERIAENLGVSREAARKRYALAQERLLRLMQA